MTSGPIEMDDFVAEVRTFLDAAAPRRPHGDTAVEWGAGIDRISYFSTDPPDVEAEKVAAARAWQRRYSRRFSRASSRTPLFPAGCDLL